MLASGSATNPVSVGRVSSGGQNFWNSSGMETHVYDRLRGTGRVGLCPRVTAPWDQQA